MMKKEYNAMYDKLVPEKSDDELLRAVLSGKDNIMNGNKKRKRKAVIIPALVAAALCVTTVGVSAANDWKLTAVLSDAMRNIFGKKAAAASDKSFKEFGFEQLRGKELSDIIDCGKYSIALKGVAADKYTAFIVYDIVFDEDFDYGLSSGEEWRALWYQTNFSDWVNDFKQDNQPMPGGYSKNEFLSMDGNIAHCYTEITSGMPLQDKTMELISNGLYRSNVNDPDRGEEIDCGAGAFSITFDFDTLSNSKTIEPNTKITSNELGDGKVVYLSVSPFGLVMNFVWEDSDKICEYAQMGNEAHEKWVSSLDVKIVFKDGTEKGIDAFEEDGTSSIISREDNAITKLETALFSHWKYPIAVDELESVTVCGKTIKIN